MSGLIYSGHAEFTLRNMIYSYTYIDIYIYICIFHHFFNAEMVKIIEILPFWRKRHIHPGQSILWLHYWPPVDSPHKWPVMHRVYFCSYFVLINSCEVRSTVQYAGLIRKNWSYTAKNILSMLHKIQYLTILHHISSHNWANPYFEEHNFKHKSTHITPNHW